jgi:TOMM system kinase/cyclase fusion protein
MSSASSVIDLHLRPGTVFEGRYEVLDELGSGTFGRVYKARQMSTGQEVAVKVLRLQHATGSRGGGHVGRFRREIRLCAELSHPNIVRLLDSGETDDGKLYAVFEYVPGSTLKHVITEQGKLELCETIHLMSQVLDALSCAHARGVVHRDLKPENIMVTRTGARRNAMVLDFGLGGFAAEASGWGEPQMTRTQEMMGTPCYAAPEQLRGEPPSTRSDIYSWGLIFLECLTGDVAVRGFSAHEVILKQVDKQPVPIPPEVSSERLRELLETVTAKRVEERDVTIEGLLRTLSLLEAGEAPGDPAAVTRASPSTGERRQVTVLSCRLSISRCDGQRLDLEQLDELIHAQHALYAELAGREDGRMVNGYGHQAMLVFGYRQAHEDDARRAARTGLGIAAETSRRGAQLSSERGIRLDVHIGIHTGLVIARELRRATGDASFDLVGLTPQVALRLGEMAESGEILASLDTVRLLRTEIEHDLVGDRHVADLGGAVPVFRLTGARQIAAGAETIQSRRETHLVGRAQQLAHLLEGFERARVGRGEIVLITGEPGIGKSRLVRELRRRVPASAWLGCQCMAENQNSPLRPLIDLLSASEEPLEALLTRCAMDVPEHFPLLATLLSLPPDERYPAAQLTPEKHKEHTLQAVLTLILRMAVEQPLVFAIEDLHWADPTTLDLVTLLVDAIRGLDPASRDDVPRIHLLLTSRPQFVPTWSMENASLIALTRLAGEDVEAMVNANLAADRPPLPRRVLDEIILRSDGVPLFVEEVTRVLVESGLEPAPGRDGVHAEIPGSLRDLLMARLDSVSGSAKETAQLASVLGREFRYALLRAASHKAEALVRADISELANTGLLFQRRSARSESYVFKHALLRDTAYESMMQTARQVLHEGVATTLRERFPDVERSQPEVLAMHFEHGARIETAAEYWRRAGDLALKGGTYVEAIRHLQRGLDLIHKLPPVAETRRLEASLTEPLGTALVATQGYTSPEVEKTFGRAISLCQELGEDVSFRVLYGIWGVHFIRSERETTAFLLERLRSHAERTGEPISVCTAEAAAGLRAFFSGDFARARDDLAKATRWYHDESIQEWVDETGYDGRLYPFAYLMWALEILGNLEQAIQTRDQMIALALDSPSPYPRSIAWGFALNLAHDMGEPDTALELSAQAIAHCTEQKLPFYLATALPVCGWALVCRDQIAEGMERIQQGLALLNAIGIRTSYGYYLSMLAEAHLKQHAVDEGLKTVDEALGLVQTLLDRFYEAELLRIKGELLLLSGRGEEAEMCLRQSLHLAQRQRAQSFVLRTAISLGQLLRQQGRTMEAGSLLTDVCGGFGTRVEPTYLRMARQLAEEIRLAHVVVNVA